jgi:hypothetical protein
MALVASNAYSSYKSPKVISVTNSTPSPTEEIKLNTEMNVSPTQIYKKVVLLPTPTTDPDPIITCNSKTGALQVKSSVCKSYTDCPNGSGGFIFESQESCKARWDKISSDLKNSINEYGKATLENMHLQNQLNQNQINNQPYPTIEIPSPIPFNTSVDLKIITPTPVCTTMQYGYQKICNNQ